MYTDLVGQGFCGLFTVLQRLVRMCGEVKAGPTETEEIKFLCTVCAKLKSDPYLVNFFIQVRIMFCYSIMCIMCDANVSL